MNNRVYLAIDLKSFYASVECRERNLDPFKDHLVVADASRTDKTICLAVSPGLKAHGVKGRPRLFEVKQQVKNINRIRQKQNHSQSFTGSAKNEDELVRHPEYALDFHIATPRMALYITYSTRIYQIYLRYVASEDIHVYSIDEVFIDITGYLKSSQKDARSFAKMLVAKVYEETGITATCGIGTNLYLAKIAMDIIAKHIQEDNDGVRIASLNEFTYRKYLWNHTPLTDFWRIGHGIARRLQALSIETMGDLAAYSLRHEDELFKAFGVNAELLIDHAWGIETTTIHDIQHYRPKSHSTSIGQVLSRPYSRKEALLIVKEMADGLSFQLIEKNLVCDTVSLFVSFDEVMIEKGYEGACVRDMYGRVIPKPVHGQIHLPIRTGTSKALRRACQEIFEQIVPPSSYVRRLTVAALHTQPFNQTTLLSSHRQISLFEDEEKNVYDEQIMAKKVSQEEKMQKAILKVREKYGKNSIIRGMDKQDAATAMKRNEEIGGHRK